LLRQRELLTLDEERILDQIQRRADRLRLVATPASSVNRYLAADLAA
jgi:hypothetical protein